MTFFDRVYKQIFKKEGIPEYNGKKYIIQEMYSLQDSKVDKYHLWKSDIPNSEKLRSIFKGLEYKKLGLSESNQRFSLFNSRQSNGFYVLCDGFLEEEESIFILEFLKDKMIELGYYMNHSSKDIYEQSGNIKTLISYYLKPKLSGFNFPLEQGFGNIHLEFLMINNKPDYLKLMANVYSDRNYKESESFEALLEALAED